MENKNTYRNSKEKEPQDSNGSEYDRVSSGSGLGSVAVNVAGISIEGGFQADKDQDKERARKKFSS